MKDKAFTLIELLAVILILGILLLICIPSISEYIEKSRKETYISTVKELVSGAAILVTKDKIDIDDTNTTYYIPYTCISMEDKDKARTPYGDFDEAYVVVTIDEDEKYDYYFYGRDTTGMGFSQMTEEEALSSDCIKSGVDKIHTDIGLGRRKEIKIYSGDCSDIETEKKATKKNYGSNKNATFDYGVNVNKKMKQLADGSSVDQNSNNYSIKRIAYSETEPTAENKQYRNRMSASYSSTPIYMWFESETGTMWWWSEDDDPCFGSDASFFFNSLRGLKYIEDLDMWDTSNVTTMECMFQDCASLEYADFSYFNTSKVRTMAGMLRDCDSYRELDLTSFDTSNVTDMNMMFAYGHGFRHIDLSSFDTSNVRYMYAMFDQNTSLVSIDLSNFNTSKVTTFFQMFSSCSNLKEVNMKGLDMSHISNFRFMFAHCYALEKLDASGWVTSSATNIYGLVNCCTKLKEIDISGWDTRNVTDMGYLFANCKQLQSVDVSNFDTSKVKNMECMFYYCQRLRTLDLSNWDVSKVTNIQYFCYFCSNMRTIYASDAWVLNYNYGINFQYMFHAAYNLVGGNGTRYSNSMMKDPTYSRVDKPGEPGLLTYKEKSNL